MIDADLINEARNLIGRYCEAVLRNDAELFGNTWAADARWVVPGADAIEGRPEIVDFFTRTRSAYPLCVQEILSQIVSPTGEEGTETVEVTARTQIRELQWRSDGSGRELIGVYDDLIARGDDGTMRFARRSFDMLYRGSVELTGRLHLGRRPGGQPDGSG